MGDPAPVDRHHLVRAVLEQPGPAGRVDRVADPGAPAEPVPPGSASTRTSSASISPSVSPPSRCSCSRTTAAFQSAGAPGATCCRSQPPQRSGPAYGQGGSTRSRRGGEDLDRVGPQEALVHLGDLGDDPLAGQRVPDEDHLPVDGRATQCPPCATASDGQLDPLAPPRAALVRVRATPVTALAGARSVAGAAAVTDRRPTLGGRLAARRDPRAAGRAPGERGVQPVQVLAGGRGELPGHAGHHHARLEQQPALEPQRALVVQQVLPPAADHVLGDEDGDHVARRAPGAATATKSRIGRVISRYGESMTVSGTGDLAPLPLRLDRPGVLLVHVDGHRGQRVRPGRLGVGDRPQGRLVHLADQHDGVVAGGQHRRARRSGPARRRPGRSAGGWRASAGRSPPSRRSRSRRRAGTW